MYVIPVASTVCYYFYYTLCQKIFVLRVKHISSYVVSAAEWLAHTRATKHGLTRSLPDPALLVHPYIVFSNCLNACLFNKCMCMYMYMSVCVCMDI